ncbi:pyridoxamine 5'-phosphate oxidase [Bacteroidales bacterium]|nr:pyridoxamine 5'-phosphate oxidase [Bacteroidales bacterium]
MNLQDTRNEFLKAKLHQDEMPDDPLHAFDIWIKSAIEKGINEPTAMTLSSIDLDGKPSSRIVLLKEYSEKGLAFFSNYNSKKGLDIKNNPNICLLFFWPELEQQIRIEGKATKTGKKNSDRYFNSRPTNSQLSAWASPQSQEVQDRQYLEQLFEKTKNKFKDNKIYRPDFWGGYIVSPTYFEFWQGRQNRLHDRVRYKQTIGKTWKMNRLAP